MTSLLKPADFTLLILTVCSLILVNAAEPKLEIFPHTNPMLSPSGQSISLMCAGKATDEDGEFTEMKWFDPNGEEIPENSPNLKKTRSKLKLNFNEPRVEDSGTYRCTALFSNTLTLEASIKIDFFEPIKFEDCPTVQNLVVGREGRIKCRVMANPRPSINWEKDEKAIESDRMSIDEAGIVVASVSTKDAGLYTVEAFVKETGSNEIREIEVNVLTPPKVNELPEEFVVIQGEEYTITCGAVGSEPLDYNWFDPNFNNLNDMEGFIVEKGRLTIRNVQRNSGGVYTCKVTNPAGEDQATVRIEVQVRPTIVQLENITREEGKEATFECRAEGVPRPTMSIRRDKSSEEIIDNPDDGRDLEVSDDRDFKVLRLRIDKVKRDDDGLYYCKASNPAGVAEKAGHLEVQFRPDMSRTLQTAVKTWSAQPANLSCIAEANPNATISWKFQGEAIEKGDQRFRISGEVSYSSLLVMTEKRDNSEVYGTYTCEAKNALGENSIAITLDEATPPGQITQIVFDKVTSTTITFRLMGPGNTGGMPITYFIMKYKRDDEPDDRLEVKEWPKDTPYILSGLLPRAKYQFSVTARNVVGDGPWKTAEYVMPEETAPEPPKFITKDEAVSEYPDRFEVRWDIPNDNGKPILKYGIRYFRVERGLTDWNQVDKAIEQTVGNHILAFELEGLLPDSYYKVEIRATNEIGNSLPESVVFRTSKGKTDNGHTSLMGDDEFPVLIIVAIVLVALFITLVILDITCFFRYHCGLLYLLRYRTCGRSPEKVQAGMEEGRACVKEVSTANNGKIKTEFKSPSSPDQLPPPDKLSTYDEKLKTEMDNPAFENKEVRPADLIIDENFKNKSPKGSKSSIGKSSPV